MGSKSTESILRLMTCKAINSRNNFIDMLLNDNPIVVNSITKIVPLLYLEVVNS